MLLLLILGAGLWQILPSGVNGPGPVPGRQPGQGMETDRPEADPLPPLEAGSGGRPAGEGAGGGEAEPGAPFGIDSRVWARAAKEAGVDPAWAQPEVAQWEVFQAAKADLLSRYPDLRHEADRRQLELQMRALERWQDQVLAWAAEHHGVPLESEDGSGRRRRLVGFEGERPLYLQAENANAAVTTAASFVRRSSSFDPEVGSRVDGGEFSVGVFDSGVVRPHVAFGRPDGGSRVLAMTAPADDTHADHVGGTIGAGGENAAILGMAPEVTLLSWQWPSTAGELGFGMAWPREPGKMAVSNTSLGSVDAPPLGGYTSADFVTDDLAFKLPYYLAFKSVGNEGPNWETVTGYDKEAKNILVVAALEDGVRNASGVLTGGAGVISFSSRGPIDDGRIKPDISANGRSLLSTSGTSGTLSLSGSSMSSPNAAGSAVLLQDYFGRRFPGQMMRAATLMGLIKHTADDLGPAGPDYTYGWGLMNTLEAGRLIRSYADNPAHRHLIEAVLENGAVHTWRFNASGTDPIRVTLSWTDPPSTLQFPDSANDRTPDLVNDLDLTVTGPSGQDYLPWVMPYVTGGFNPADRGSPATRGVNRTDNTEQVLIAAPLPPGEYVVTVSHAGVLTNTRQEYSLVLSGFLPLDALPPPVVDSFSVGPGYLPGHSLVELAGSGFLLGARLVLSRQGVPQGEGHGAEVKPDLARFQIDQGSLSAGLYALRLLNPDGQESEAEGVLQVPLTVEVWSARMDTDPGFQLGTGWAYGVPSGTGGNPSSGYTGPSVLGYNLGGTYTNNIRSTRYATSPPISTVGFSNLRLRFARWLGVESSQYDRANIQFSTNNVQWQTVWTNPAALVKDDAWVLVEYELPVAAENQPSLRIRFGMGPTDGSVVYCGWNIDDISIVSISNAVPPLIVSHPVTEAVVGVGYFYEIELEDPDTPLTQLLLEALSLPPWLSLSQLMPGRYLLQGVPPPEAEGEHPVALRVSDGSGGTDLQEFVLHVRPPLVNQPPSILIQRPLEGRAFLPSEGIGLILVAEVEDDGFPVPSTLQVHWAQAWGPPGVSLESPQSATTEVWFPGAGHYGIELVADDGELQSRTSVEVVVGGSVPSGVFVESGGRLVIEAESFDFQVPGTGPGQGILWESQSGIEDASASAAVRSWPGVGTSLGDSAVGARLVFPVWFNQPGTYFAWVRTAAPQGGGGTLHLGLDGMPITYGGNGMGSASPDWGWSNSVHGVVSFAVAAPGKRSLDVWVREGGTWLDRLLVTTDPQEVPVGLGPPASLHVPQTVAPIPVVDLPPFIPWGAWFELGGEVSALEDMPNGPLYWLWYGLDPLVEVDSPTSEVTRVRVPAPGEYALRLAVDDGRVQAVLPLLLPVPSAEAWLGAWLERVAPDLAQSDRGPLQTPRGDGVPNLLAYAWALDWGDPSVSWPKLSLDQGSGAVYLDLSYRRWSGGSGDSASGYYAAGLMYVVEVGLVADTIQWVSGPEWVEEIAARVDHGDGSETVTVRLLQALDELDAPRFLRLRVNGSPP